MNRRLLGAKRQLKSTRRRWADHIQIQIRRGRKAGCNCCDAMVGGGLGLKERLGRGVNVVAERWCGVSSKMKAFRSQCTINKSTMAEMKDKKNTTSEDCDSRICREARVQKRVLCRRRESKDRQQWRSSYCFLLRLVVVESESRGNDCPLFCRLSPKKDPLFFSMDLFSNLIGFPATLKAAFAHNSQCLPA